MGSWVTDPRSPCRSAPSPPSVETGRRHSECPLRVMCLPSASHLGCVANIRGAGHVTRQSGSHCVRTSVPPLLLAGDVLGVGVKRSCPRLAVSPDVSLHCRKDVLSVRPRPWTQEPHRSAPCQCVPGNRVLVNAVRRNAWMGSTGMSPSHLVPVKTRVLLGNSRLKIQPKWLSSKHMKTCLKQCLVPDKKHHYFVKTLGGGGAGEEGRKAFCCSSKVLAVETANQRGSVISPASGSNSRRPFQDSAGILTFHALHHSPSPGPVAADTRWRVPAAARISTV